MKKKNVKEAVALKELMHREAGSGIRKQISEYLRCLKEGMWTLLFQLLSHFMSSLVV